MNILTLISKRSIREIIKEKRFLKFFTSQVFQIGDMIEIIDGNKKTPAIILKTENALNYKEEIRSGNLEIKKLILSKTGIWADGKVMDSFSISEIKRYLKDPGEAKKSKNKNIISFFPRKILKKNCSADNKKVYGENISDILKNKILKKEKIYHNPMQEMVDTIRNYFGEKARYGYGSFSYYIGMFKQVSERDIWQFFGEAKQSKKSLFEQKKIFWYKVGKYIKEKNRK